MKEYEENGVKIQEYNFKDWKHGGIVFETGGDEKIIGQDGKIYIHRVSLVQFNLIYNRRKKIYKLKVEHQLEGYKNRFQRKKEKSSNKSELRNDEIKSVENRLYNSSLKTIYKKIIVLGEREYHWTTNSDRNPDVHLPPQDYFFIQVEALFKFLNWLKGDGQEHQEIELKSLCLFLRNRTGFIAPAKNDTLKWDKVLKEFGFNKKFKPSSVGKTYNDLNNSKDDLISPVTSKNYKQAEKLFEMFPDEIGLKNLLITKKKNKQ